MQAVRTVGDLARITLTVYDIDGNVADASTVTATVTAPDGVAEVQSVTQSGLGSYYFDYPVTQAGRHTIYWVTTGLNSGATTDAFDAQSASPVATAAELKRHLNVDDYADDTELLMFLDYATTMVESKVGVLTSRSVTTTRSGDGTCELVLPYWPILSVTSVEVNGTALTAADYTTHPLYRNTLVRRSGYDLGAWTVGFSNIDVEYTAGRSEIPGNYRLAVLELTRHLWQTQRGSTRRQGTDDYAPGIGFSWPRRVLELLDSGEPGIA